MNDHDDERDPHLRQALRHAPDADVQAPAALSRLILDEARAKARDAQPVGADAPAWALRLWAWLARPAVATAFAGVMAATLVGVMWWDQPMDEARPRRPAVDSGPAPATPAAPAAVPPPTAQPAEPPATPRPPAPGRHAAPPAPKPAPARRAEVAAPTVAAPIAEAVPPAPPPPAPAPAADTATADTRSAGGIAAPSPAGPPAEERKLLRSTAPADAQRQRSAAKAALNDARVSQEAEAYTAIASVRAAVAAEPARWRWQRGDGTPQPMSDRLYAWLAQLDQAAGTRWQPRSARDTAAARGRALQLLRDGQVQHTLRLTEQGVSWESGQTAWQLALPTDTLASLHAALDAAAP